MSSNSKPRKIVEIAVWSILFITISTLSYIFFFKKDIYDFNSSAQLSLKKSSQRIRKAHNYKQEEILNRLGDSDVNSYYYRFDDFLRHAKINVKNEKKPSHHFMLNIEFNHDDTIEWESQKDNFSISNGRLKINNIKGAYFKFQVNLPAMNIAQIEIKVKTKRGRRLRLGWPNNDGNNRPKEKLRIINLQILPDSNFHIYRLNMKQLLQDEFSRSGILETFYLFPSDNEGDVVEIDYIRFLSKTKKYTHKRIGVTYEKIRGEMRKVLFAQAPSSIIYELQLPNKHCSLSFGMGIIKDKIPVSFRIIINGTKEIFSQQISSIKNWIDDTVSLGEYTGQTIKIEFKTHCEKPNIALWSNPLVWSSPLERFNIIIVLEDALRADHMSCYEYSRDTTPIKKEFIKKGILFLNAFSQSTKTRSSCPSIHTSLHPTATRVWKISDALHENYITLAEILRNKGFRTASFIQNGNAGPSVGLHQGFGFLYSNFKRTNLSGDMYTDKVLKWIEKYGDSNFFIYLHLIDPHGPYNPPAEHRHWYKDSLQKKEKKLRRYKKFDPEWIENPTIGGRRALYDGEIRNNDFYFNIFLKNLEKLNILSHTLIVFISDHGEHLGEHGLWEHSPPGYIQVIKTPMIMVCPEKLPQKLIISHPVQNIDVLPTILDLTGLKKQPLLLAGDSLLPLIKKKNLDYWKHRLIVSDEMFHRKIKNDLRPLGSIIYGDTHILSSNKAPFGVFNYLHDSEELEAKMIPEDLKRFYKVFLKKIQKNNLAVWQALTKGETTTINYDPKTLRQLRALGYVE
jgi:arylsulfatase A-like enzyme